jgi:hypothetical protein
MPSSKRRSSGGASTPSKPPLDLPVTPDGKSGSTPRELSLRTPDSEIRRNGQGGSGSSADNLSGFGLTATVVAVDDREGKGKAFLWLSEAAMVSTPIAIGSLVSVCTYVLLCFQTVNSTKIKM